MKITQPKLFYRYQAFNGLTLDALCFDSLYFSHPTDFNDPLDCQPTVENDTDCETLTEILITLVKQRVIDEISSNLKSAKINSDYSSYHSEMEGMRAANDAIKNIRHNANNPDYGDDYNQSLCWLLIQRIEDELLKRNQRGICCFSSQYSNPLLWSHYADQHKGFCVGYSLNREPQPKIYQVNYGGERMLKSSLIADAILNENKNAQRVLREQTFLRKAKLWSYEKEWRLIEHQGLHESPLELKEIIFGIRCPMSVIHAVQKALKPRKIAYYRMVSVDALHPRQPR